jgi:hypothetical protein
MVPRPSVLGRIELLGDFHCLFDFVEEVDVGRVGADVSEEQFGRFLAEF